MIRIDVPGREPLALAHLVLDYNGTLAVDGDLVDGVATRIESLAETLDVHVVTADTFGKAGAALEGMPCRLSILPPGGQDEAKRRFVRSLGPTTVVAVGNGRNDALMLADAALGIAVMLAEGASREAIDAADVVSLGILPALDLLLRPKRLIATLRA